MTTARTQISDDSDERLRVGSAPDSWGVWFPDDEQQLPWHQFLDELVQADYEWLELGRRVKRSIAGSPPSIKHLAMVPLMPVWRNFFLGSEISTGVRPFRQLAVTKMRETADLELRKMGVELKDVDQPVGTLSGGQRQCVAIARAIHFGARVLILDEPTAALGVKQSGVVLKYITAARDAGLAVIFTTHNPHHAFIVGDQFAVLARGALELRAARADVTLQQLTHHMAGGAELDALKHELKRIEVPDMGPLHVSTTAVPSASDEFDAASKELAH